ncbi:hypothetical protein AN619_20450 [Thermotalea metallivorans]|uniref:Uncharacterized protein n=1 Tax=Thermotalea metallivorans TaxID=520762 RepID=A0A140L2V0_9FIRM|nr:hypothetical protein AN619_20450 [Thermotalea metallivorans]
MTHNESVGSIVKEISNYLYLRNFGLTCRCQWIKKVLTAQPMSVKTFDYSINYFVPALIMLSANFRYLPTSMEQLVIASTFATSDLCAPLSFVGSIDPFVSLTV